VSGLHGFLSKHLVNKQKDQLPMEELLKAVDAKLEANQKWKAMKQNRGKPPATVWLSTATVATATPSRKLSQPTRGPKTTTTSPTKRTKTTNDLQHGSMCR